MTEVLNPFHTHTMYNSPPSSPSAHSHTGSTDWKQKYFEVSDLLAETRAELDEFTRTSKELEEELERDLERTEKAQEELRSKVTKVEGERDEWKNKFMNLQHSHNTTTNSLQRELDATRQSLQLYRAQVRELELGNDDLERNERQATSSLVDVEQKYAKALEDKILLEHELQDKAVLEETCQRLRDELRDANVEISVLKDQMDQFKQLPLRPTALERQTSSSSSLPLVSPTGSEGDNLIRTPAPDDISFADLQTSTPIASSASTPSFRSSRLSRMSADIFDEFAMSRASPTPFTSSKSLPSRSNSNTITSAGQQDSPLQRNLSPSSTITSMSTATRLPTPRQRTLGPSPTAQPSPRIPVPTRTTAASRSRGVQMVSEMRARVKTLEQKIHTNMPRLRVVNSTEAKPTAPARPRATSRAASSTLGTVRTPKKSFAVPKEPASPWVMVADDGDANITIHQPESPERPPRLPALPTLSPLPSASLQGMEVGTPTPSARPPSRTIGGLRSVSAMGRPTFGLTARFSEDSAKPTLHPRPSTLTPAAFPTLAPKKDHPPRANSATGGNFRPPTRIVAFAASTAAASPKPGHLSSPPAERPTTPPLQSQPVSGLRRAHTTSSPSKPPTIGMSLSPRKRVDSSRANTKDAGTTPARFAKARVVTSPEAPPPPMPPMPTAHVKSNVVLGQSRIGAPSVLTKSRIGRPGSSGKPLSEFGAF